MTLAYETSHPLLDVIPTPIDIGICTYQRAHIAATLRSIAELRLNPARKIRVIVADNDTIPSAQTLVTSTAAEYKLDLLYIHAPSHNIAVARNACLNAATAPLLAFIDDDEIVTPSWLQTLLDTMEITHADIAFGPVQALYDTSCPEWLRQGDYCTTNLSSTDSSIQTGYAGNVLLRRTAPALTKLRFRLELGQTGGEDTLYFAAAATAGAILVYAPKAIVIESVATERQNLLWLLKRRFRFGQTHGLLLLETTARPLTKRIHAVLLAGTKSLYCLVAATGSIMRKDRLIFWTLRSAMHAGVVARLLGKPALALYGKGAET